MADETPVRADFRYMKELLPMVAKEALNPVPEQLGKVARVFARAGGDWIRLFQGSERDINLLKKVLKIAVKKGHISKAPDWGK